MKYGQSESTISPDMPTWIQFGRRKKDIGLVVDFHKHRAIVRANTAWIKGTQLEQIPPGPSQFSPAMVLMSRDWKNIYFLIERDDWDEDNYFKYALKRMGELGITKP